MAANEGSTANNNADASISAQPPATFAKPLPDVSKIEVFAGQNFRRWQERVHTLLDMHGVVFALSTPKPDAAAETNQLQQWIQANKVCRHTLLSALSNDLFDVYCSYKESKEIWDSLILKYTAEDVVRQRFIIANYYRWTMNEEKDIKVQINEYHKLLEDLKTENISLPDEFVSELLIEKLPESWTDYKQQLKHRQKQMPLSDLITHIIIEDANRKESAAARTKAMSAKANTVQDKPFQRRVRVANELGAGNAKGAKFACVVSVATTVVVGFVFWLIIVAFNKNLALIFTSSSSVIQMVNELAMLLAFTVLINCIQPVLSGVAVGSGRQAIVAYINIGSYYLVGIPLGVLLGWLLPSGIVGMWIGMMSGTVVQTLILIIITMKYDWEKEVRKAQILIKEEATSNQ